MRSIIKALLINFRNKGDYYYPQEAKKVAREIDVHNDAQFYIAPYII